MASAQSQFEVEHCGFAKIVDTDGGDYYMRKYEIVLGRKAKAQVDVVLGEDINISRQHAVIRYNFEKGHFELEVLSKNGVTVDGQLYLPQSEPVPLRSQEQIRLGSKVLYFLLPRAKHSCPQVDRGLPEPAAIENGKMLAI